VVKAKPATTDASHWRAPVTFETDRGNRCLWRGNVRLDVTPKAFDVLEFLRRNPDRLVSHDEILDAVWPNTFVQPEIVKTYVRTLRRLLDDNAQQPRFIETRPRCGYRFVGELRERRETAAQQQQQLAGRSAERQALQRGCEDAGQGNRSGAVLSGESGIGKSALLADCLAGLRRTAPVRVASAYGSPSREPGEPLAIVTDLLRDLTASIEPAEARACLRLHGPSWAGRIALHPPAEGAPARVSAGSSCLAREACAIVENLAQTNTLVLAIEDLQWADQASLDFLQALLRRRYPAKLFVVATFRQTCFVGPCPVRETIDDLVSHGLVRELRLGPLSGAEIETFLSLERGHDGQARPDDAHARSVQDAQDAVRAYEEEGGGNPLILRALYGARCATGELATNVPDALLRRTPEALRTSFDLQLREAGPFLRDALETGSIAGQQFCAWAVAKMLDVEQARVEDAFERLAEAQHFLRHDGCYALPDGAITPIYRFKYRSQRRFLLESQAPARRVARYRRFGEAIVSLWRGDVADVAGDVSLCFKGAGDWDRAIGYARLAASNALERSAPTEAVRFLREALGFAARLPTGERDAIQLPIRQDLERLAGGAEPFRSLPRAGRLQGAH
jgi:DNA-binding winged helix-turn-helix (wHTH) protein